LIFPAAIPITMARAKVTHSEDAVQITFDGDRNRPEPATAVIKFPGGHVEVTRCSDGTYWAHTEVTEPANVIEGRIDHTVNSPIWVADLPNAETVKKIAIRVAR
jgi:hypothetical protein